MTLKQNKRRNPIAKELRTDPRYSQKKSKHPKVLLNEQKEKESNEEIRAYNHSLG